MSDDANQGIDSAAEILGSRGLRDAPLGALTTYRVGGRAALLIEAHSHDDLILARRAARAGRLPLLVVGKGSNLLVADAGFGGLAVVVGEGLAGVEVDTRAHRLRAGGGAFLPVVARRAAAAALTGLEWAVGVPGSVGGAVRMNAGGHGADISATLAHIRYVDLAAEDEAVAAANAQQLGFGYRRSTVADTHVVVEAVFTLAPGDRAQSEERIADIVRWRRENQPGGQNAGSVFTNPPGDSAGRLVEAAGLKGFRMGSATVSPKHANFIQADEAGSADDVLALLREVQRRVENETGVHLEPELRLVGFGSGQPKR